MVIRHKIGRLLALRLAMRAFAKVYRSLSGVRVASGDSITITYTTKVS